MTVESEGLFLTGFVIYKGKISRGAPHKMWGNLLRALYPKSAAVSQAGNELFNGFARILHGFGDYLGQ